MHHLGMQIFEYLLFWVRNCHFGKIPPFTLTFLGSTTFSNAWESTYNIVNFRKYSTKFLMTMAESYRRANYVQ